MDKRYRVWLLKICVTLLLLGTLAYWLSPGEVISSVTQVSLQLWLMVVATFLLGHCISATKWWILISRRSETPVILAIRAHFAGLMANLCLPGLAGGDVVRAGWVMRNSEHKEAVATASVADRLIDCSSLLLLASVGALRVQQNAIDLRYVLLILGGMIGLGVATVIAMSYLLRKIARGGLLLRVSKAIDEVLRQPSRVAVCLTLSLGVQTGFVYLNYVFGQAVSVDVPFSVWLCTWPLAKLISVVPISLGGFGVRESSLVALMQPFGADSAAVLATGLMWDSILLASGLVGGAITVLSANYSKIPAVAAEDAPHA